MRLLPVLCAKFKLIKTSEKGQKLTKPFVSWLGVQMVWSWRMPTAALPLSQASRSGHTSSLWQWKMRGTCRAKAPSMSLSKKVCPATSRAAQSQLVSEQFSKTCVQRHNKSKEWRETMWRTLKWPWGLPFSEEGYLQFNPAVFLFSSLGLNRDFWSTLEI